jgi:hypothetical protein
MVHGLAQLGVALDPELDPLSELFPEPPLDEEGRAEETTGAIVKTVKTMPNASHNHFVLKVTDTVSGLL